MTLKNLRRNLFSRPLFKIAKRALPSLSETERQALSAGDVWWDSDLFSGNPDWQKLLEYAGQLHSARKKGLSRRPGQRALSHAR